MPRSTKSPEASNAAVVSEEPRRHRGFLALLALVALLTAPFPFAGAPLVLVWGLPLWLWWSLGMTALLSAVTVWGIVRLWRDDGDGYP